jgi:hypothetical protein
MTDEPTDWMRDALFKHTFQMGAVEERQRATDARADRSASEIKSEFVSLRAELQMQYTHLRGEIKVASDAIERRRVEDTAQRIADIAEARKGIEDVKTLFRRLVTGLAILFFLLSLPSFLPALMNIPTLLNHGAP